MKKIITSVLMLVCFMFCFTACGDTLGEEYWIDTSNALTQYFNTPEYTQVADITFNSNIETIIKQDYGKEFAELKNVYAKLFTAGMFFAKNNAAVLTITPINTQNGFRNKIVEVNNNLETLKTKVLEFLEAKTVFEDRIDFTAESEVSKPIEKSRLVKFKMDYLDVIQSAYKLSLSLYDAYTLGYYTFSDFVNIDSASFSAEQAKINRTLAINGSNLQLVDSAIDVLKLNNAKEVYYDYNNYWQISQKFFDDVVVVYTSNQDQLTVDATLLNKFIVWKGVYDEFLLDSQRFENVVKDINFDILKRCNNDAETYANETKNPLDQSKAEFFLNYYKNVNVLYDYTKTLV